MPIDILMPALSPTMKAGKLSKWRKEQGEFVNPGDVLAEVETDKAIMEVEAVDSGVLSEILVPEGTANVPVNTKIATLLEEGEEAETSAPIKQETAAYQVAKGTSSVGEVPPYLQGVAYQATKEAASATGVHCLAQGVADYQRERSTDVEGEFAHMQGEKGHEGDRLLASPLARRLAREASIDLSQVRGTGPMGRIIKRDLSQITEGSLSPSYPSQSSLTAIPLSPLRQAIASRLSASKQQIPHFYLSADCDVTNLVSLRQELNSSAAVKLSLNDFVVKAAALSLERVPEVNASWSLEGIVQRPNVDVCVAVSIDGGLMTPIVFGANKKSIVSIAAEVKALALSARERRLKPNQYEGGTFTVSNLGMYGIVEFAAIINPPQAAILAIGSVEDRVCRVDKEFTLRNIMRVTLSCDHRVIDGVIGARWLSEFRSLMALPLKLVL